MVSENSPICFRVSPAERNLLDAVAYYQGESLSSFVRNAVIDSARALLDQEGRAAVLKRFEEVEDRRSRKAQERLKHLEEAFESDDPLADADDGQRGW